MLDNVACAKVVFHSLDSWSVLAFQGLDSGFGGDDDIYNVYDKAWRREGSTANAMYRPSKNVDRDVYGDDVEKLVQTNR